jgi:hypothetical protein
MEHVTTAVPIFTFSPVQCFIVQARRAVDCYPITEVLQ